MSSSHIWKSNRASQMNHVDQSECKRLLDLLILYSRAAIDREIAHSLNNALVGLSLQQYMTSRALHKGDYTDALKRAEVIGEEIGSLKEFAENLAGGKQISPLLGDVTINDVVAEILMCAQTVDDALRVLSLQQSAFTRVLTNGDCTTAIKHLEVIGEEIRSLKEFAENLACGGQISPFLEDVAINDVVGQTLMSARMLPSFSNCTVSLSLANQSDVCHVHADSIRVLLLSFLQKTIPFYSKPGVSVSTEKDGHSDGFYIHATGKSQRISESTDVGKNIGEKVGTGHGGIPLKTMKSFIESLDENIHVSLKKNGNIGFTCSIAPAFVEVDS